MVKRLFLKTFVIILCFCLAACEKESGENSGTDPNGNGDIDDTELVAPVLEWWELYNPNGFDTFTGALSNPNKVAIDVSYDLVYYKDGKEVARSENWANFQILPDHKDIIWGNYDIPKGSDVDDVRMENIFVSKAYDKAIDGKYEYIGTTDGYAYFDFTFESKPTLATITFVLYNDMNNNRKRDKGEIVITSGAHLMEQKGRVSFETTGDYWTDYEVYFNACYSANY